MRHGATGVKNLRHHFVQRRVGREKIRLAFRHLRENAMREQKPPNFQEKKTRKIFRFAEGGAQPETDKTNGNLTTAKGWRRPKVKPRSDGWAGGVQTTHLPVLCNQGCVLACVVHPKAPTVLSPVAVWRGREKDKPGSVWPRRLERQHPRVVGHSNGQRELAVVAIRERQHEAAGNCAHLGVKPLFG